MITYLIHQYTLATAEMLLSSTLKPKQHDFLVSICLFFIFRIYPSTYIILCFYSLFPYLPLPFLHIYMFW